MTVRRRWTDMTIETELAPVVAELGRMPTRRELADRGLGGAWSAMQRRGGVDAWRDRLAAAPAAAGLTVPQREHIEHRAYFIALERGGDPLGNWLAAEAEVLAAA